MKNLFTLAARTFKSAARTFKSAARTFKVRVLVAGIASGVLVSAQSATTNIPYSDAKPIFQMLQEQLWPAELRTKTPAALEALWSDWLVRRDASIRARVQEGDDDSIINLLLFGTTFTRQPRVTEHELAGIVVRHAGSGSSVFVPSPLLKARIEDFVVAVASPGGNERLQFARQVLERKGLDPTREGDRSRLRRYLEDRAAVVGSAVHASTLLDPNAALVDQVTIFRDRGLSSDTSISIDFGIEQALDAIKGSGLIKAGMVRRIAIVGPGLDFTDKQEGHDFYPQQTIQPFAVIDSLMRLGLAASTGLQVTAFDLSPRVIRHLEAARARARAGRSYALVLPREIDRSWTPDLMKYWERFGDRIGEKTKAVAPPPSAGRVEVRSVLARPPVVLSVLPRDLNIVVQRFEPLPAGDQFDLILATNILLYYDVFEQSLAVANVAKMLRPGGVFLTNDRIIELPASPIRSVGYTDVTYMTGNGANGANGASGANGAKGDRITWYQRP